MVIAISGLSGTGKTTVAKELSNVTDLPIVIRCTTRPIRPGEVDGVDYHFINEFNDDDFVGIEHFEVDGGDIWSYGTKKSHLVAKCIMVINPLGIENLRSQYDESVVDVMVKVDESERMKRILDRNDNQTKEEVLRRSSDDLKIFESYKPAFVFSNDESAKQTALFIRYVLITYGLI